MVPKPKAGQVSPANVPGSFPSGKEIESPPSVVSSSEEMKSAINAIMMPSMAAVTYKNESCWVITKARWEELASKVNSKIEAGSGSIPRSELIKLQQELADKRLKLNEFENVEARHEYAVKTLTDAHQKASKLQAEMRLKQEADLMELHKSRQTLLASLEVSKTENANLAAAVRKARAGSDVSVLAEQQALKENASAEITRLNNDLQKVNSERNKLEVSAAAFAKEIQALRSRLQDEESRYMIAKGGAGSFANIASASGPSNVDLRNPAHQNLNKDAKSKLDNVPVDPSSDTKNALFWLKATLDATKHSVYKPYKLVFGGLLDDLSAMQLRSRKLFSPFAKAVRDSLLPTGKPLTQDDLRELLEQIEVDQIFLTKPFADKGYKTLAALQKAGHSLSDNPTALPHCFAIDDTQPAKIKLVGKRALMGKKKGKGKVSSLTELYDSMSDASDQDLPVVTPLPVSDDSDSDPEEPVSYWVRVRRWFHLQFDGMNQRVRTALRRNSRRLHRYYKLSHGNFFQKCLLVPYSWYLWAFP